MMSAVGRRWSFSWPTKKVPRVSSPTFFVGQERPVGFHPTRPERRRYQVRRTDREPRKLPAVTLEINSEWTRLVSWMSGEPDGGTSVITRFGLYRFFIRHGYRRGGKTHRLQTASINTSVKDSYCERRAHTHRVFKVTIYTFTSCRYLLKPDFKNLPSKQ